MNCWNCKNHKHSVTSPQDFVLCEPKENLMLKKGSCKDWSAHEAWDYKESYPYIFGTQEVISGR